MLRPKVERDSCEREQVEEPELVPQGDPTTTRQYFDLRNKFYRWKDRKARPTLGEGMELHSGKRMNEVQCFTLSGKSEEDGRELTSGCC